MTRQDHQLIALAIAMTRQPDDGSLDWPKREETIDELARNIAQALAQQNPLFERGKFFTATRLVLTS